MQEKCNDNGRIFVFVLFIIVTLMIMASGVTYGITKNVERQRAIEAGVAEYYLESPTDTSATFRYKTGK